MSRTIQDQISQMDWPSLRKFYREENHKRVVRTEGLSALKHTGDSRGKDRLNAMADWDNPTLTIPHDAGLDQELRDLNRDAEQLALSEGVRFSREEGVVERTFTPRIEGNLEMMTDQEIDQELQKIVTRDY